MAKASKTPRLSTKIKGKPSEHPKHSITESTITENLRSHENYIKSSKPDRSTLTHFSAPSSSSIRVDDPENQTSIPYERLIILLPESRIFFILLS